MIEHILIDLVVAYAMKRTNMDIYTDIVFCILFSHFLLVPFLFFSFYIPLSIDSIAFLFMALYACDAILFGECISFYYSLSSACRLFILGGGVACFLIIRFLKFYNIFDFFYYVLKHLYNCLLYAFNRVYNILYNLISFP